MFIVSSQSGSSHTLQVKELASIVFGIRLFNRAIGKGGAGIDDVPGQLQVINGLKSALARRVPQRVGCQVRLSDLQSKLHNQTDEFCKLCNEYTMTINHMHRQV